MQIKMQRAWQLRPLVVLVRGLYEAVQRRTKYNSWMAKNIALRNGILVEGRMKGSRHCFIREYERDIR